MKISIVSIFPEIFTSFLETSLIGKAQTNWHLEVQLYNPREKCTDPHQQIDDLIYGGWAGMLLKAQPIIDTVEEIIKNEAENSDFSILFPAPSETLFSQKIAYWQSKKDHLIFICGRYEGIDHRCELYFQKKYPSAFKKLSLWQFIVLGWEDSSLESSKRNKAESRKAMPSKTECLISKRQTTQDQKSYMTWKSQKSSSQEILKKSNSENLKIPVFYPLNFPCRSNQKVTTENRSRLSDIYREDIQS